MTVDDYLDAAMRLGGFPSESALSRRLGICRATVSSYRTKRAWPSERVMLELADLAGLDRSQALLDLNQWRSEEGPAREIYASIAERLRKAATIAGAAMIAALLHPQEGNATATLSADAFHNYTLCARRWLIRALRSLAPQGFTACS